MGGITTKITFYVIVFCYVSALIQNLGILPADTANSNPDLQVGEAFTKVSQPGEYFSDPLLGPAMAVWQAIQAVIGSFWETIYIFNTLTKYGLDPAYAATAQALVIALYGYDLIAIYKGYEIL